MKVTLRNHRGEVSEVSKEDAEMRAMLGYYFFNQEDGVYEYTEKTVTAIKERAEELRNQ